MNLEFWQVFGPEILDAARGAGIEDFFAFGEVFDQQFGSPFMSHFSTQGRLQSTIDFGFQLAARDFASQGDATDGLRAFFETDDWYTDADSNAYAQPTFLGNHDMGRIGYFLQRVDQVGASDAELLARSRLAHALMFFARGQPVVYYGDEQGFTGDGGDKDAREDMFANAVPVYEDNDLIGTDETTSDDNFDPSHPLFQTIRQYANLYHHHPALRTGSADPPLQLGRPGDLRVLAGRPGRAGRVRRGAEQQRGRATAIVPTYSQGGREVPAADEDRRADQAHDRRRRHAAAPCAGARVRDLSGREAVPASDAAPAIDITSLEHGDTAVLETTVMDGHAVLDRIEVAAALDEDVLAEVTFAVREGDGDYVPIGTDDNAPYRVFFDAGNVPEDATLSFRAIVNDLFGHLAADQVVNVGIELAEPSGPETPYALIHYQRPAGDYGDHTTGNSNDFWDCTCGGNAIDPAEATDWTTPKPFLGEDEYGRFAWVRSADDSQPVNFIVHKGDEKDPVDSPDRSFDPGTTPEIGSGRAIDHLHLAGCGAGPRDRALRVRRLHGRDAERLATRRDRRLRSGVGARGQRSVAGGHGHDQRRRGRRRRRRVVHAGGRPDRVVPDR